jgi:predicted nucleotidyltransferase
MALLLNDSDSGDLYRAFRRAVRAKIERDLAAEEAATAERRARVRRALGPALDRARSLGLCRAVWLFGSYAWGAPGERSDVDLLAGGCSDPEALTSIVGRATDTDVHVVPLDQAPESLRARAMAEGESI